jgi:hypothetical protein
MSAVVEQRMINLPFLDDTVPALILSNGQTYFPVYKVCQALGIHSDRHIRHWKNLALWFLARKLPFRTERQGKRQVWCLPNSSVPFLYGLFDWHSVSPERRLQLNRACQEQARLVDLAYREMQWRYRTMRHALFTFLTNFTDIDALLEQYADIYSSMLANASSLTLVALIERGRSLFQVAIDHARKMIRDQEEIPIIDTFRIDADNTVIECSSMPLLPIVTQNDYEYFSSLTGQLTVWMRELQTFWRERE